MWSNSSKSWTKGRAKSCNWGDLWQKKVSELWGLSYKAAQDKQRLFSFELWWLRDDMRVFKIIRGIDKVNGLPHSLPGWGEEV